MTQSPLSLADNVGVVFIAQENVYRAINVEFESYTQELINSGLIKKLIDASVFPDTRISNKHINGYNLVLEHEYISPIVYPYEWSPEMLRKAALCVLTVNKIANSFDYELKDAHPYNVIFKHGQPIFIDFGSIVKKKWGSIWIGYDEFINCYCHPLRLTELGFHSTYKNIFLLSGTGHKNELLRISNIFYRFVGLKTTRKIQVIRSALQRAESIFIKKTGGNKANNLLSSFIAKLIRSNLNPFKQKSLSSLASIIDSFNLSGFSTWSHYHLHAGLYHSNGEIKLSPRLSWVVDKVKELSPSTVLELAGNQGVLSRELAHLEFITKVICTDYDQFAIDQLVLKNNINTKIFAACFDFMCDIQSALSKERPKRLKSDVVIALAITHHLTLSQNLSLSRVFEIMASYTNRYLIIEFMPLGLWDGNSSPPIPSWYNEEWFTRNLALYFSLIERHQLESNRIAYVAELINRA